MRSSSVEIEKMLLALGCSIRSEHSLDLKDCDPEKQLLKSLKFYWSNNSVFFLVYTSLVKRLYPYVHVDRLVKLAQDSILTKDELCLLSAIFNNLSTQDQRFKNALKKISQCLKKMEAPPKSETDPFLIQKWGLEKSLEPYGVQVRTFTIQKNGKLSPLEHTFQLNPWLKYRALFGPNTRSDCAFVIQHFVETPSASEVARIICSSRQAVSAHYKDLVLLKKSLNKLAS